MAKVIAFSGGCHSGKTTTMNKIAEHLKAQGYSVKVINELMREKIHVSIDELRKSPHLYLEVQESIISKKIDQECAAFNDKSNTIYLVDRAITDSIFYLDNYVDKSNLTDAEIIRLCNLDFVARQHAMDAFNYGYDMVITFEPFDIIGEQKDAFRPKQLNALKDYEYQGISTLNRAHLLCKTSNYVDLYKFYLEVNTQVNSVEYIISAVKYSLGV